MKRTYAKAAIAVLALILLWIWLRPDASTQQHNATSTLPRSARTETDDSDAELSRTARRKASGRVLPEGDITTHHHTRLKDFVLPKCVGHKVNLATAIELINNAYKDACYFSLETPLSLTYNTIGESKASLTFSLTGKTWKECIESVAALAGMEAKFEAEVVTLIPWTNAGKTIETTFRSPPNLALDLKQMLLDVGEWDDAISDDPNIGIPEMLRRLGIIENANICFDVNSEQSLFNNCHFNGSKKELNSLVTTTSTNPICIETHRISTKLISSKNALDFSQMALEPDQTGKMLHALTEQSGVSIQSLSALNTKLGEIARVENNEWDQDQFKGMEISYQTEFIGLKIGSKIEVEHASFAKNHQPSILQILTFSGDSQIKHIGSDANGHYYLFTTLQQITNGQPAESISHPWHDSTIRTSINYPKALFVPGMPNQVYSPYGNTLIDVKDIPSGELMPDPAYPDADGKIFRVP